MAKYVDLAAKGPVHVAPRFALDLLGEPDAALVVVPDRGAIAYNFCHERPCDGHRRS